MDNSDQFPFQGFPDLRSNFVAVPNIFFDERLSTLSEAKLKVLLYIFRRILGWGKSFDVIALSQFMNGIVTKKGRRLDYGTGLSKPTVIEALKELIAEGYILRFIAGKGSARKSIYFLNTLRNRQIVDDLECGKLSIEKLLGQNPKPTHGKKSQPKQHPENGQDSQPTKEPPKQNRQKKENLGVDNSRTPLKPQDDFTSIGDLLNTLPLEYEDHQTPRTEP
jgi:hypothetical protein